MHYWPFERAFNQWIRLPKGQFGRKHHHVWNKHNHVSWQISITSTDGIKFHSIILSYLICSANQCVKNKLNISWKILTISTDRIKFHFITHHVAQPIRSWRLQWTKDIIWYDQNTSKSPEWPAMADAPLTCMVLRLEYSGKSRSIPWLMMPWLLALPGHRQPWHWLYKINRPLGSIRKDFNYLGYFNVEIG